MMEEQKRTPSEEELRYAKSLRLIAESPGYPVFLENLKNNEAQLKALIAQTYDAPRLNRLVGHCEFCSRLIAALTAAPDGERALAELISSEEPRSGERPNLV